VRNIVIVSLLLLSGCGVWRDLVGGSEPAIQAPGQASDQTPGAELAITTFTWKAFENYKYWMTPAAWPRPMGEGFFAVAKDGRSWGLTGCTANSCAMGTLDSADAIQVCQERSGGVPCLLFAHDDKILVPYRVAD
jgi:hypothetical protein